MASFDLGTLSAKLSVTLQEFLNGLTQAKGAAQQTRTQLDKTLTVPLRVDPGLATQTLQATSAQASLLRTALEGVRQGFVAMATQGTTKSLEAFQTTLETTLPELARLRQDLARLPTPAMTARSRRSPPAVRKSSWAPWVPPQMAAWAITCNTAAWLAPGPAGPPPAGGCGHRSWVPPPVQTWPTPP